jgi:hypothetical protein
MFLVEFFEIISFEINKATKIGYNALSVNRIFVIILQNKNIKNG